MFCTGGIRCEKSTNYLLGQGVEEVYHLKGGILKYLEEVPEDESAWQGDCFVFDGRVSVGHGLARGAARAVPCLPPARSCPRTASGPSTRRAWPAIIASAETSEADKARFRERQRQIGLAAGAGRAAPGGRGLGQAATVRGVRVRISSVPRMAMFTRLKARPLRNAAS